MREDDSITHSFICTYLQGTGLSAGDNNNNKIMSICARTISSAFLDSLFNCHNNPTR